jgi:DNA-binding response OmpR family regulator
MKNAENLGSIRVLISDDDSVMARRLGLHLVEHGFEVQTCRNVADARALILSFKPKFILADLVMPDGGALGLIDFIKQQSALRHQIMHVIVMSGHNNGNNVKMALGRGARDYLVKPFTHDEVLKRLVFHSRNYRSLGEVATKDLNKFDESGLMLHLTDLILKQALGKNDLDEILFNLTRMVSMKVDGVRCSVVQCLDQKAGIVVTSNDDRMAAGIQLDLYRYPEIVHVMNTGILIAIENIEESPELRHIKDHLHEINFNSLIVCPISRRGEPFGVLSLRLPPEKRTISDNEVRFVEIVAHVVSLVLSNEVHKTKDNYWRQNSRASVLTLLHKKS